MNRITSAVNELQKTDKKAFVPFITAGYPDMETTEKVFYALEKSGADIIELGMPFSDPLADGPTIQSSSHEAILSGTTPDSVFDLIVRLRKRSEMPILLFAYSNLVVSKGISRFMERLNQAGGDGLLIPDLPAEESAEFRKYAKNSNIRMIFLISPLTSSARMRKIENISDDFVYCVSVSGVTGARRNLSGSIVPYLEKVRKTIKKPFVVGFGVSNKNDAKNISGYSDGVVVGSAIIKVMQQNSGKPNQVEKVYKFASEINEGVN